MSTADVVMLGEEAAALAIDIASGNYVEALKKVRSLADQLVLLVPVDGLKEDLTDSDRRFADLSADVAEAIKLDPP